MSIVLKIVLIVVAVIIAAVFGWGLLRTRKVERDARQVVFAAGLSTLPTPGPYQGAAGDYRGAWQGKVFEENGMGKNAFRRESGEELKYPFKYYVGKAVRDTDLDVVVLDYNQPGNPWWLRYIRDEMVQLEDGSYLGKVLVYILPNFYLSLGYFTLTK